ncbi:sucrose synthase-like [Lotus japonicus]|uniref:sucrose synthase-like n=1 Tax=Lotus japonicus TaxID=34305 RepID=UPI00258D9E89|nr:sucrose synthase-like [Lotus japonicus]
MPHSPEAIVLPPWVALAVRPRPELQPAEFLHFKEELVDGSSNGNFVLVLDFEPFNASFPRPTLNKSIGNGVEFLNRHLSAKLFHDKESLHPLLEFLRLHNYNGKTLMLNDRIQTPNALQHVLRKAEEFLGTLPLETPYSEFEHRFQEIGLERGWGDTAERVLESIQLLLDLLEAPDPCTLKTFLGRIPMVFNVVILSPHGYFAQDNVLGYPDTGGQVVYILDQVRALENEMLQRIKQQGLDIVPRILIDVAHELAKELQGKPDLIVGNYSDGNIVASSLAHKLGVTQCTIAHALEKTKYPESDIYWKKFEEKYHFSCQFTADLFAMNHTDFIITSTFQEIAGSKDTVGQYVIGTQILVVLVLLRYLLGRVEREIKLIPTSDNCQADVAVSSGC